MTATSTRVVISISRQISAREYSQNVLERLRKSGWYRTHRGSRDNGSIGLCLESRVQSRRRENDFRRFS